MTDRPAPIPRPIKAVHVCSACGMALGIETSRTDNVVEIKVWPCVECTRTLNLERLRKMVDELDRDPAELFLKGGPS